MPHDDGVRAAIVAVARKARRAGLVRLSAGNLSARLPDGGLAITPAGLDWEALEPADVVLLDAGGRPRAGTPDGRRPSSETPMHRAIYRALPRVAAVVHTHSPRAMTFAVRGKSIPAVCLEVLSCGGPIPVAAWACPGTERAGEAVVDTLRKRERLKAVLLRNHGLVAVGSDLEAAFRAAWDAEVGADVAHAASLHGDAVELTAKQIDEIRKVYPGL